MVRRKRIVPPYELAMHRLGQLRERRLAESGHEKEYYTELTDILRQYLEGRFGINAMEMTSREIMDRLYDSDVKDKRDYVRQILHVADFVKFAKVRPLPADNIAAFDNAVRFVEETKPVPVAEEEADGDNPDKVAKKDKAGTPVVEKGGES